MLDAIRSIFIVDDGSGRNILQKYGWHLVFTFIALYYFRENVLDPFLRKRASQKSYKDATRPGRVLTLTEKMIIAREEQQKKAQIESDAAKKKRAAQKKQQLEKSSAIHTNSTNTNTSTNTSSKPKKSTTTTTTTTNPYRSDSYNPMAPNASSGSSYRPAKRSTGGGGGG